jgi:hypothetical protein
MAFSECALPVLFRISSFSCSIRYVLYLGWGMKMVLHDMDFINPVLGKGKGKGKG